MQETQLLATIIKAQQPTLLRGAQGDFATSATDMLNELWKCNQIFTTLRSPMKFQE